MASDSPADTSATAPDGQASREAEGDLVMLRGLEILREWLSDPDVAEMLQSAGPAKPADEAGQQQA